MHFLYYYILTAVIIQYLLHQRSPLQIQTERALSYFEPLMTKVTSVLSCVYKIIKTANTNS
jgi:hypothetical protein